MELLTGQRLRFIARSRTSGRGFTGDFVAYDEAMPLDADDVAATLPILSARQFGTDGGPQVWYTASAGNEKSTQLGLIRRRGLRGGDPSLFFAEWSIDPHTESCPPGCTAHDDPASPASWAKANPGLGFIHANGSGLTHEAVRREQAAMTPFMFGQERLGVGRYPVPRDGYAVIPKRWWEDALDTDPPRPHNPALALAVTRDRSAACIGIAGGRPDGRVSVEIPLGGHRHGTTWAVKALADLAGRVSPCAVVVHAQSPAGALITGLEEAGLDLVKITATEIGHAFGQFYDAVRDDQLRHGRDGELDACIGGAAKRKAGAGEAWDEDNSAIDITPLIVVTFAHWAYLKYGPDGDYDAADSVAWGTAEVIRLFKIGAYGPADLERLASSGLLDAAGLAQVAAAGVAVPASMLR